MPKLTAIYTRVSTGAQDIGSQIPDLERWVKANVPEASKVTWAEWFTDEFTGKTIVRPGWLKLEERIDMGEVETVVVWRLDRLGRTVSGLTKLFEEFTRRGIRLVSVRDGLDLSTPAGRLMAHVLASVAQYETEVRAERVAAGQARARMLGKTWGGWKHGVDRKLTPAVRRAIVEMYDRDISPGTISKLLNLSRPTIYRVLGDKPARRKEQKREEMIRTREAELGIS